MNDSNIKNLYNTLILSHYKNPYHKNKEIAPNHSAYAKNKNCGDEVTIYFTYDKSQKRIKKISFKSKGCVMCQASASVLAKYMEGKKLTPILMYINKLHRLIEKNEKLVDNKINNKVEKILSALAYVREFPTRKQCVLLPWNAFEAKIQELINKA